LVALTVETGESLSLQTVIQLGAEIEAVYLLASLESRGFDSIEHQIASHGSRQQSFSRKRYQLTANS
jgi:hypothetical protein